MQQVLTFRSKVHHQHFQNLQRRSSGAGGGLWYLPVSTRTMNAYARRVWAERIGHVNVEPKPRPSSSHTLLLIMMKVACWSLLILSLGWLPSTVVSATTTPMASPELGEINAFILPRILQAHRRLNGSRTIHHGRVAAPSNVLAALEVLLDTSAPISEVDPQFLSVTIDAGQIRSNWSGIALRARRIVNMAFALYPCMLRVGGTSADFIIFNRTTEHQLHSGI